MARLNVTLITRSLTRGGAQTQVSALARGLAYRGHNVHVAVFYSGGALGTAIEETGVPVVSLGKSGRWNIVGPVRRLTSHLRKTNCDVVYSFLPLENLLGLLAARLTRVPIVWGIRGARINRAQYGYASRILYGLQFRLMQSANAVISNSHAAVLELGESANGEINVVPNGIDCLRFVPSESQRVEARTRIGVDSSARLVGIVARLDPMKDHNTFLDAAHIVAQRVDGVRFVVAGDGPRAYRTQLEDRARELGIASKILWLGEISDPATIYNGIDVAVSSSAYGEGFSNSVGEAMACGLPIVVTDVGDSAQIVGDLGRVVPPRSPSLLAEAIIGAMTSDRSELHERRHAWIADQFGLNKMIERTEAILSNVSISVR